MRTKFPFAFFIYFSFSIFRSSFVTLHQSKQCLPVAIAAPAPSNVPAVRNKSPHYVPQFAVHGNAGQLEHSSSAPNVQDRADQRLTLHDAIDERTRARWAADVRLSL